MTNTFETINGSWVDVETGVSKGTFAIELKNNILLTIHVSNSAIHIHKKNEKGVYQYLADFSFESANSDEVLGMLFGPSIKEIYFNDKNVPVFNHDASISDFKFILSLKQKDKWNNRRFKS